MEFSKQDMKILKGVAIMMMLALHLFCRKVVNGLYDTFPTVHGVPLIYYLALFCDACVPIYCFASGYGLYVSLSNIKDGKTKKNFKRIFKLLINYWIILLLFVLIGFIAGVPEYPGHASTFFMNFFVLSNSYNGAWWFLQTYIILVCLTPVLFKWVQRYSSISVLLISGVIYFVTYVQRIKHIYDFGDFNSVVNSIVLVGTSFLPFIVGAIFAKEKIYSRIHNRFVHIPYKNVLCIAGIFLLILLHAFEQSMFIAPFTGIVFICLFNLINKGHVFHKILDYFGNHSTNVWLIHMFFYMTIFPRLTFAPKYPILIFIWLLFMSIVSSYGVNLIYKPIIRLIDKKDAVSQKKYKVIKESVS